MRQVFHAAIAPELLMLRGIQNNANLSVKLRQVVSIRFPFSFREGEAATLIATDDDLNLAASLRLRRVVDKSLLTVLPTHLGTPTGGESDATAWAYALGGDAFEQIIGACFAPQPLGSPVAFDPQVIRLDPDQGNAAQVQAMQDEIDRLRAQLAQAQASAPPASPAPPAPQQRAASDTRSARQRVFDALDNADGDIGNAALAENCGISEATARGYRAQWVRERGIAHLDSAPVTTTNGHIAH